jgi:hypothetical protein
MVNPQNRPKAVKFGCQDTRRNLPNSSSSKRGESNFVAKFERAYMDAELRKLSQRSLASGREFALDGFGRADVLFMAWKSTGNGDDFTAVTLKSLSITAIEGKISDWRKGLMQASRYRFFANRALLVLPPDTCATALAYLETFRDLNVGLWQFDPSAGVIRKHFTPRHGRPLNSKARERAIQLITGKLKFR